MQNLSWIVQLQSHHRIDYPHKPIYFGLTAMNKYIALKKDIKLNLLKTKYPDLLASQPSKWSNAAEARVAVLRNDKKRRFAD